MAFKSNEVAINWQAAFVYAAARYFRPSMVKARLPAWPQWPSLEADGPADDVEAVAADDKEEDPWAWMDEASGADNGDGAESGAASGLWLSSFAGASGGAGSEWQPWQAYAPTTVALGLALVALLAAAHSARWHGEPGQRQWAEWVRPRGEERSLPLPLAGSRGAQLSRGDMI